MSDAPLPSATVVLIRDSEPKLELLLLQRSPRAGKPGPWVFPGGKVDPADRVAGSDDPETHARRASVRETREEAGLEIPESGLVTISRWITPPVSPRRFDTWFFLGELSAAHEVKVDGEEICDHRWLAPAAALAAAADGEIGLAPPTFVTVTWLAEHARARDAIETLARSPVLTFRPQICQHPDGVCMLYPGDAGYEAGDPDLPGPRHRLWAEKSGYRYDRS